MSYQLPNKNQASLTHFLLVIYLCELYGNILLGIEALIMMILYYLHDHLFILLYIVVFIIILLILLMKCFYLILSSLT